MHIDIDEKGMISFMHSLSELKEKEVINIINGEKIGFIDDIEFENKTEKIVAFIIYGRKRFYGLFGKDKDIIISPKNINLIGRDTILVSIKNNSCDNITKTNKTII